MPTRLQPAHQRRLRWLLALPKAGVVLLLAATAALLWLVHSNEVEEERNVLIKDVLWLEQNMRFHLDGNAEQLQQLAGEMAQKADPRRIFQLRAEHIQRTNPEISQVLWINAERRPVLTLPAGLAPESELESFGPAATGKAFDMARRLGTAVYSEPFRLEAGGAHFALVVPLYLERRFAGALLIVYPMDALLANLVPWWFAEKHEVVISDDNDVRFAAKSHMHEATGVSYELPFDPPGYGLKFVVNSYRSASNPLQRFLVIAILLLASGVVWSLWRVRELVKLRSRAEEALRAEHAFRTAMENSLTVGMRARDLTGRIIYVNPAFCRMTGFSSEELVGRAPPMPYWVPEQIDETLALHRAVLAGEAPPDGFELTLMRKDGERFQALIYEARLIDGNGQHTGWMASVLDVTERRRAEELARQQQEQLQFTARLVTMGEMASTLAHELNQPLAAIASYNTGCLNLLGQPDITLEDIRPALEKIGVQAQRAGRIIRRVHDFVRKSEPKLAPCRIREIIEDCLGFVEAEARKRHVQLDYRASDTPLVPADRLMLEQVLLNLIRNSMEAMGDTPEGERLLRLESGLADGEIRVAVADRGCGLSPEVRDKLFSAFFTTKPEGMGVGLSICRSIIEFHRGRLWAEDAPGGGTIFIFTLPLDPP